MNEDWCFVVNLMRPDFYSSFWLHDIIVAVVSILLSCIFDCVVIEQPWMSAGIKHKTAYQKSLKVWRDLLWTEPCDFKTELKHAFKI